MTRASTRLARTWVQPPAGSAAASIALAALTASACSDERDAEAPSIDAAALGAALAELADEAEELTAAAEAEDSERGSGERLGEFKFTYYVIAQEPETSLTAAGVGAAADVSDGDELEGIGGLGDGGAIDAIGEAEGGQAGEPADGEPSAGGAERADKVALHDNSCEPIAEVSPEFARDLRLQGSGVLRDGRVVSASKRCDCDSGGVCFFLPGERYRWGIGAANRSLSPFRSVAVDSDVVSLGQTLYVPELDGLTMPGRPPWGGFVHDGCVIADDRGGSVDGRHLDFFAARRGYYRALLGAHGLTSVTVYDGTGRCDDLGEGRRPAS